MNLPNDGLLIFAKRDCPTCALIEPVLQTLDREHRATVVTQDDPAFPANVANRVDDTGLEWSYRQGIEVVPTLIRLQGGREVERTIGWDRAEWQRIVGRADLGSTLPALRPGCGSKTTEPGVAERLQVRFGDTGLQARAIELGEYDDPIEACYARGWSDGLPVVPPTDERILRMLSGTRRKPDEIVGLIPPNLAPCTIEKVAINAVMAGCKPEYMPVILAVIEAALEPRFTMHGLLCTTYFSGPVVIVNGPIARRIGMNAGLNALGQGNRANSTITRALNLTVRNVGGGLPGGIDRATLGGPHKVGLCFAEDETDPFWTPLAQARGIAPGRSAVTLFQGEAAQGFTDQRARTPEELTRSLAMGLFAVNHPKLCEFGNAVLVLSPEHYGIYRRAGWDRARLERELFEALKRPGKDLVIGAGGVAEGIGPERADDMVSKFWPEGLLIVRAGGEAGMFSAIMAGWLAGRARDQTVPVTKEVRE